MKAKQINMSTQPVGSLLKQKGLTISAAESCTGGALLSALTDVPGSSAYVIGGVVAYSNRIKINQLGVNESDIEKYGAVSESVALQMAKNIAKLMKTDIGVSTTGIAGPGGGSNEKPVGMVWMGFWSEKKHFAIKANFDGDRLAVKKQTVEKVLEIVLSTVSGSK